MSDVLVNPSFRQPLCKTSGFSKSETTMFTGDELCHYTYELPEELIAQHPVSPRDSARLLVLERATGKMVHYHVHDLPRLLQPGDCLVFNDTRVLPARLYGLREKTGGRWEGLFLQTDEAGRWKLIGQTWGKPHPGETLRLFSPHSRPTGKHLKASTTEETGSEREFRLELLHRSAEGIWTARPFFTETPVEVLEEIGEVPLPPYIRRLSDGEEDRQRYQTVFAREPGAVAAPTAGLHFTPELLNRLQERGISSEFVTLHVGLGTFRPINVSRLSEHRMHAEWCRLPRDVADRLNRLRAAGKRLVAVGTTVVRTLESAVTAEGLLQPFAGRTDLFIKPPYTFRAIDALLTNFHLPQSSLLVLVSAFAGAENTRRAYETAVQERYRFYSYGDAMLIV